MRPQSPLTITNKAINRLKIVRVDQKVPNKKRLRVRSRPDEKAGMLAFDMFFDKNQDDSDRVYKLQGIELILDVYTAHHLMGSILDLDPEGEFIFTHLDLNELMDINDIQYN